MTLGYVSIDGTQYAVPVLEDGCKCTANTLDMFAERDYLGNLHRQMIGVYYNYTVQWSRPHTLAMVSTLATLFSDLTQAIPFRTFIMPDGYSFVGYIGDGVSEQIGRIMDSSVFWNSLSASFIASSPARTP